MKMCCLLKYGDESRRKWKKENSKLILLTGGSVARIGKRSPELPWLKDKEGKSQQK